jgi:ABC-type molybdate transport system substrate-binding protein
MTASSAHPEEAALLIEFLASDQGLSIFRSYGFSVN